jgi:hypothetical protein
MGGKSKNRKSAAEHFYTAPSNFSKCEQNMALQRKGMGIATFLPIAAGNFSLLSYWLVADILAFPIGFPITFRNFLEAQQ